MTPGVLVHVPSEALLWDDDLTKTLKLKTPKIAIFIRECQQNIYKIYLDGVVWNVMKKDLHYLNKENINGKIYANRSK